AVFMAGMVVALASLLVSARTVSGAFGRRTARYGLNTAVMVVLLLAVVGLVEAVSFRHNARVDLTENRRHSLSAQAIQLLRGLKTEINAAAVLRRHQPRNRVDADPF